MRAVREAQRPAPKTALRESGHRVPRLDTAGGLWRAAAVRGCKLLVRYLVRLLRAGHHEVVGRGAAALGEARVELQRLKIRGRAVDGTGKVVNLLHVAQNRQKALCGQVKVPRFAANVHVAVLRRAVGHAPRELLAGAVGGGRAKAINVVKHCARHVAGAVASDGEAGGVLRVAAGGVHHDGCIGVSAGGARGLKVVLDIVG